MPNLTNHDSASQLSHQSTDSPMKKYGSLLKSNVIEFQKIYFLILV